MSPRWEKGSSSLKVQCDICEQQINYYDVRHIEKHTPRELIVTWITTRLLQEEDRADQFYLYNLRKIILLRTDIDPRDMLNLSIIKNWLVRDGIPRDILDDWIGSF